MTTAVQMPIRGLEGVRRALGRHLGYGPLVAVTQEMLDGFLAATEHARPTTSEDNAGLARPFRELAHDYLMLAMAPVLLAQLVQVEGVLLKLNYGCERVRFPQRLPIGASVQLGATFSEVRAVDDTTADVVSSITISARDLAEQVCTADLVFRYYERPPRFR